MVVDFVHWLGMGPIARGVLLIGMNYFERRYYRFRWKHEELLCWTATAVLASMAQLEFLKDQRFFLTSFESEYIQMLLVIYTVHFSLF